MRPPNFTTERLTVTHWESDLRDKDRSQGLAISLSAILTKSVLEPLPPSFDLSDQPIEEWISNRESEGDVYLVRLKSQSAPVGLLFWVFFEDLNEGSTAHLGYLLSEDVWGQGLATELVKGLIQAASDLAPIIVHAGVARMNPKSSAVLRKSGFLPKPEASDDGMQMFSLVLT